MANVLPPGYFHTNGASIVDGTDNPVRLAGVNWYGFDCNSNVAGGLDDQPLGTIVQKIVDLGFNTIRLPFSVELVTRNPTITAYLGQNPDLVGHQALDIMSTLIMAAGAQGLRVILDCHRSEGGWSTQENGLWYTDAYPEQTWLDTWTHVVDRFSPLTTPDGSPIVIGCDLRNELGSPPPFETMWPAPSSAPIGADSSTYPYKFGATWGLGDPNPHTPGQNWDWAAAAERAGSVILGSNPNLLIFVEGVRYDPAGQSSPSPLAGNRGVYWFGGNLMGVRRSGTYRLPDGTSVTRRAPGRQITLAQPNRLVYSVHDYGPDAAGKYGLPWVPQDPSPDDCNKVWDEAWGFIVQNSIAPIWIGEFGTPNGYQNWHHGAPPPPESLQRQWTDWPNGQHNVQGGWFSYLTDYIKTHGLNWCYWAINGSQSEAASRNGTRTAGAPDWYGILTPDWSDVASQPLLARLPLTP